MKIPETLFLLVSTAAACSPPPETPVDDAGSSVDSKPPAELELSIGSLDDSGQFSELSPSDTMEIVVGFQGLIFIDVALRGPEAVPDRFSAFTSVSFDDATLDFDFSDNFVEFDPPSGGHRICPAFRVPFGADLTALEGQTITLDIEFSAPQQQGTATATFRIVDEEQCIEEANGEFTCE